MKLPAGVYGGRTSGAYSVQMVGIELIEWLISQYTNPLHRTACRDPFGSVAPSRSKKTRSLRAPIGSVSQSATFNYCICCRIFSMFLSIFLFPCCLGQRPQKWRGTNLCNYTFICTIFDGDLASLILLGFSSLDRQPKHQFLIVLGEFLFRYVTRLIESWKLVLPRLWFRPG